MLNQVQWHGERKDHKVFPLAGRRRDCQERLQSTLADTTLAYHACLGRLNKTNLDLYCRTLSPDFQV